MDRSIGIDLGTTNSCAAIEDDRGARVLPTRLHEPLMPSVVSFRRSRKPGGMGEILVGRAALNNAEVAPEDTIFSIKRLMGRTIDDPKVEEVRARFPFVVTRPDDPDDAGVRVVLNEMKRTPAEISALILRELTRDAERALGDDVTHAVITVPAYFTDAQRAATRQAGRQAGLTVRRMIDEPTAAAIAFGMDRLDERHRVLVYDMGGGTFDISVIQMTKGQFEVLAMEGDMWLGGDDFDREIVSRIIEWVKAEYDHDPSQDKRFMVLAKRQAEAAKIALSVQEEADVIIPGASRTPDGDLVDVDVTLSRNEFERAIQRHVDRSMDLVRKALDGQNLTPDDLTAVLMVGGSTAVPLVRHQVTSLFGEEKVRRQVDPMQCVALGAAILAAGLSGVECPECGLVNSEEAEKCSACGAALTSARSVGRIGLGEVTARSLGISTVGRDNRMGAFSVIIPKGTQYPLSRPMDRTFYTTSDRLIRVPVYEGDDSAAERNDLQAIVEYRLPTEVDLNTSVSVSFNYDKDRVLTVGIRVHGHEGLTHEEVVQRDRPRPGAEADDESWREELDATTSAAETFLEQYREFLGSGTAHKVQEDISKARQAYAEGNKTVGQRLTEALRMTILGSGVPTHLYLAERAADGAPPDKAEKLMRAARELREAYRRGDRRLVEEISGALGAAVVEVIRERIGQAEAGLRDFDGLLRER